MFSNSPFYRAFKTLGNEAVVLVLAMVVLNIFLSSTGLAVENCGPAYGEGFHGRVIISEGSDKVEKIYFERSSLVSDQALLEIANHYFEGAQEERKFYVEVPTITGQKKVSRRFIQGRTLQAILADIGVPAETKNDLLKRYYSAVDYLLEQTSSNYFHTKISVRSRYEEGHFAGADGKYLHEHLFSFHLAKTSWFMRLIGTEEYVFLIKTDNVVVETDTGRLYLVDPY